MLVQCKRQKAKIEKVVVKALWADVVAEGAESGLIVTTSSLSPGSANICKARAYPIEQANRETLKTWIQQMKTPGEGVFLGM
jgi:restriction system protein